MHDCIECRTSIADRMRNDEFGIEFVRLLFQHFKWMWGNRSFIIIFVIHAILLPLVLIQFLDGIFIYSFSICVRCWYHNNNEQKNSTVIIQPSALNLNHFSDESRKSIIVYLECFRKPIKNLSKFTFLRGLYVCFIFTLFDNRFIQIPTKIHREHLYSVSDIILFSFSWLWKLSVVP